MFENVGVEFETEQLQTRSEIFQTLSRKSRQLVVERMMVRMRTKAGGKKSLFCTYSKSKPPTKWLMGNWLKGEVGFFIDFFISFETKGRFLKWTKEPVCVMCGWLDGFLVGRVCWALTTHRFKDVWKPWSSSKRFQLSLWVQLSVWISEHNWNLSNINTLLPFASNPLNFKHICNFVCWLSNDVHLNM